MGGGRGEYHPSCVKIGGGPHTQLNPTTKLAVFRVLSRGTWRLTPESLSPPDLILYLPLDFYIDRQTQKSF